MSKETEIPQSLEDWIHDWLYDNAQSSASERDCHNRVTLFSRKLGYDLYRHLHQSPQLTGEGVVDVKAKYREWLKDTGLSKDSTPALHALNFMAFLLPDEFAPPVTPVTSTSVSYESAVANSAGTTPGMPPLVDEPSSSVPAKEVEVPEEIVHWIDCETYREYGETETPGAPTFAKVLAQRLYRYLSGKGMIDQFDLGYNKAVATLTPEITDRDNRIADLREQIKEESSRLIGALAKLEAKTQEAGEYRIGLSELLKYSLVYVDQEFIRRLLNKYPHPSPEAETVRVNLPSGAVAKVSPDASPEVLAALDQMVELAKKMPNEREIPRLLRESHNREAVLEERLIRALKDLEALQEKFVDNCRNASHVEGYLQEQLTDRDTHIELLRKGGASLRGGELKDGDKVVLDADMNNASVVILAKLNKVYSRVRNQEGSSWDVMTCRLSPIRSSTRSVINEKPSPVSSSPLDALERQRVLDKWILDIIDDELSDGNHASLSSRLAFEFVAHMESTPSPTDEKPNLKETLSWMSRSAKRNIDNADTTAVQVYWDGYWDCLEELGKEMELPAHDIEADEKLLADRLEAHALSFGIYDRVTFVEEGNVFPRPTVYAMYKQFLINEANNLHSPIK